MLVEPLVDVGRIMRREVVHDEVTTAGRIHVLDVVEQLDEGVAVVLARDEAERSTAPHVEGSHPAEGAVTDVLELAAHRLARLHREVGVATFERLDARLLVDAHDVLVRRRLVVDAQNVVSLLAELRVLRGQVHLLPMRLKIGVAQDASDCSVADVDALRANVLAEQRRRPVRYRYADVLGRSARFGFDTSGFGVREREIGRPERGASVNFATGSSELAKRAFHRNTVRRCTPSNAAMSPEPTPAAISSRASPLLSTRASVFAGRMISSTRARC